MAAPRRVELEQHVFVRVDYHILVVLRDHDGDGAGFLLLGDRLALDRGLEAPGDEVGDEFADLLLAEVGGGALGGVGELLVLLRVLDGEGGPVAGFEVEVAGVLAEGFGVDGGEVEPALVRFGDGFEGFGEGFALLGGLGEDVGEGDAGLRVKVLVSARCEVEDVWRRRDTYSHVASIRLRSHVSNQRRARRLGEVHDGVLGEALLERVLALVKRLVEHDGRLLHALGLGNLRIRHGAKQEAVPQLIGGLGESAVAALVVGGKEADQHDLVRHLELFQDILAEHLAHARQALLGHVGDDGLRLAGAGVRLHVLGAAEDFEGRVALDAVALAEVLLLGAVDLGERDGLLFERCGCFLVLGREGFAVAAPRREDCYVSALHSLYELYARRKNVHSARTRSFSWTNGSKESLVSSCTSLAAASAASPRRAIEERMIVCVMQEE